MFSRVALLVVDGSAAIGTQIDRLVRKKRNTWLISTNSLTDSRSNIMARAGQKLVKTIDTHSIQKALGDSNQSQKLGIGIALSSLGFSGAGALFYSPLAILSIPGILYITWLTFLKAWRSVSQKRRITIDVMSTANRSLLLLTGNWFFASLSACMFVLNRYLLGIVKGNSKRKLIDVFRNQSRFCWMEIDGVDTQVPIDRLETGDVIVVNAGEIILVDGHIRSGMAAVDQHILTGEAQPVDKMPGDPVFAMTILLTGRIYVEVLHAGEETTAAQISLLLAKAVDSKTDMQLWVENFTDKSVTPYMGISLLALPILGPSAAIAIMQSHFKYKGTITTSLSILSYLQIALQSDIFVKDGRTFELLNRVDTVIFDKTGTLTYEQFHVGQVHKYANVSEDQVLLWAAAAESKQTHPIARAILQEAMNRQIDIPIVKESAYRIGYGLCVQISESVVHVGSERFMASEKIRLDDEMVALQNDCHRLGRSLVFVAVNRQIVGMIELRPTVRPEARMIIQGLRQLGIRSIYIISGDHEVPTRHLAQELRLDGYYAERLPAQKAQLIDELQDQGHTVCFIGDGINDAIALKKAAVSVSLRGASTVATDTAHVVLLDQSLLQLCTLFELARSLNTNMKLTLSTIILPSAVTLGGIIFWGFGLTSAFLLPQLGLLTGVATALSPLILHRKRRAVPQAHPNSLLPQHEMPLAQSLVEKT